MVSQLTVLHPITQLERGPELSRHPMMFSSLISFDNATSDSDNSSTNFKTTLNKIKKIKNN